ncbi:NAD-dependent epimerase/dehydratase family protein [Ferruginibacter albus]|uniref:NAD-dependent epimerase/dehydratase family protein n=1 Tax=Ferruginibacter albus TaxID=2875540 RepID=UPI001CC76F50|nr:NAD(P)-dependent oxidoreductase [Ferruginibacter albus]UAY50685.1 NAD(P)-dependent oxidoreductase [Ferruginibacter albus]
MKVLVTGATGFIGNHLCELLNNNGFSIVALVRPGSDIYKLQQLSNVNFIFGDIRSFEQLETITTFPEIIFHLAADWSRLNVKDDEDFLSYVVNKGVKKIIFYSSVCAAGLDLAKMPLHESDIPQFLPNDHYGKYKYAVELFLQKLQKENKAESVILRPTLVYGPGDTNNISTLVKAVRFKRLALWDNGKRIIAPCSIQNLNNVAMLAARSEISNNTYYVADGENISIYYTTKVIADNLGFKHQYVNWKSSLGFYKGFLIFVLNKIKFTDSFATHFAFRTWTRSYDVSLKQLQSALQNIPLLSFEDSMKETINWYINENII